jgi:hypothetical protein
MDTLATLALATPLWGFALQPPAFFASPEMLPDTAAQVRSVTTVDTEVALDPRELAAEAHNDTMMNWTRGFQVATTAIMAATGVLGFIQFHDEYGFHDEYYETQCGRGQYGDPVLDYCGEATPWPHLVLAGASAGGLLGTVILSTTVDYDRAARRDGDWRTYEVTRWVALVMGVLQAGAGAFLANSVRAGIFDPVEDFDLMQGFAVAHMALGAANVGLNLANSILLF